MRIIKKQYMACVVLKKGDKEEEQQKQEIVYYAAPLRRQHSCYLPVLHDVQYFQVTRK